MQWQYVVPIVVALIGVPGVLAAAWYRYKAKALEVEDRRAERAEAREDQDRRHRQQYYHDILSLSNQHVRTLGIPASTGIVSDLLRIEREVWEKAEGVAVFGTRPAAEAALAVADACRQRQKHLIVRAQQDLRDAARADVAPATAGRPVVLEALSRHKDRDAA